MSQVSIDLSPIKNAIDAVDNRVAQVSFEVGSIRQDVSNTQMTLEALRDRFEEYVGEAQRTASVQRSETKLSGLKDDLEREFGHWQVVRRTTIGVLQAFDVGNVTNRTVGQVSEELMIQTPRYWLAPALVGLAAWSKHDEEMARVSVEEAYGRDPKKTSLFFGLVLRRQGRDDMAVRWLRHYFTSVDPASITREFTVVFEAAAQGSFGVAGTALAEERLMEWVSTLRDDDGVVEKQIDRWVDFLAVQSLSIHPDDFPALQQHCTEWPALKWLIERASALPESITYFAEVKDKVHVGRVTLEDQLDDLLEQLVTDYDEEELPLRREIAHHEAVIEENGDLDRARERASLVQEALEETTDAVTLQTMLAMQPEQMGASVKTQQIAVGSSRSDIHQAVSRYAADYRSRVPMAVSFVLDHEHSGYARTFGFPGWDTNSSVAEDVAITSLTETWNRTFQTYLDAQQLKLAKFIVWGAIGAAVALLMLLIGFWIGALVLLAATGGFVWWKYSQAKKVSEANIANLEANRQAALDLSIQILRQVEAEYFDVAEYYAELDGAEGELLRLIDTWPLGGTVAAKGAVE